MRKIFILIISAILSFIIWATISSLGEVIKIDTMINDFISRATYSKEFSTDKTKYYKVEADFELDSKTYTVDKSDRVLPGGPGDILLTQVVAIDVPVIGEGIRFYIGGHAAMAGFNYEDENYYISINNSLEITGFGSNILASSQPKSSWFTPTYDCFMAVRVKTSLENRFRAFNRAVSFLGEPYNYSFMFNLNHKKYCSDFVSQAYRYVGIDLDYDNVATTVNDIIASPYVYLTYLSILDENNIRHTYILD